MKDMSGLAGRKLMSAKQPSIKDKLKLPALLLLLAASSLAEAAAQYSPFEYSPLTGSNYSYLPMRLLANPTGALWRGGVSAPYFLINSLGYGAARTATSTLNSGPRNHYWNPNNGINSPAIDQVSPARWYNSSRAGQPATTASGIPDSSHPAGNTAVVPSNSPGNEFMPVPVNPDQSKIPPAPDFHAPPASNGVGAALNSTDMNSSQLKPPDQAPEKVTGVAPASANPFAQAFVDHVNSNYKSDISKALSDKQTRIYAQALGITEPERKDFNLAPDRIELIKGILQDTGEDSLSKINAIRLLIKH